MSQMSNCLNENDQTCQLSVCSVICMSIVKRSKKFERKIGHIGRSFKLIRYIVKNF